jgi:DNA-binding NtrC family response regulator
MQQYLENENFCVVASANVYDAFRQIVTKNVAVLITDLHTRRTQDGLKIVMAVRSLQQEALLGAVSDSLDKRQALKAIRLGVDVIVEPSDVLEIAELINARTKDSNRLQTQARKPALPKTEQESLREDPGRIQRLASYPMSLLRLPRKRGCRMDTKDVMNHIREDIRKQFDSRLSESFSEDWISLC